MFTGNLPLLHSQTQAVLMFLCSIHRCYSNGNAFTVLRISYFFIFFSVIVSLLFSQILFRFFFIFAKFICFFISYFHLSNETYRQHKIAFHCNYNMLQLLMLIIYLNCMFVGCFIVYIFLQSLFTLTFRNEKRNFKTRSH